MRGLLVAVLVAAAGCKTAPEVAPSAAPEVIAQDLQVSQELTEFNARFVGKVKSADAATIEKASFELVVDGKVVDSGEQRLDVPVPAGGEAPFELTRTAKYIANADELKAMDARGGTL